MPATAPWWLLGCSPQLPQAVLHEKLMVMMFWYDVKRLMNVCKDCVQGILMSTPDYFLGISCGHVQRAGVIKFV
eukprot:7494776-Karenia_brevis.AAC.1